MIVAHFGLIALFPAMLNLSVAAGSNSLAVQVCSGDGQAQTVQVPVGDERKGGEAGLCCAKGCHSGNSRKRVAPQN